MVSQLMTEFCRRTQKTTRDTTTLEGKRDAEGKEGWGVGGQSVFDCSNISRTSSRT